MEELRCYELKVNDNIDNFVDDFESILIYSGVDMVVKRLRNSSIEFYGEPYLKGKLKENKIVISQEEIVFDENQNKVSF